VAGVMAFCALRAVVLMVPVRLMGGASFVVAKEQRRLCAAVPRAYDH
jgi:hypothetical protein